MAQKDLVDGVEGISTKLFLMLGYLHDEVKEMLESVKEDLMDPKVRFERHSNENAAQSK